MITLKKLNGENNEMADLQSVIESAPAFSQRTTGALPGDADAQSTYGALPPGKTYSDKFVFNVYENQTPVGCVDLIRGYPDRHTAWIGLLLINENLHGRGLGQATYLKVEKQILTWPDIHRIRLSVVATNDRAVPFWLKMGFVLTGDRKPYTHGTISSEVIILEKNLS